MFKNTTSSWIWMTIIHAYEDEGLPPPLAFNPHELGALVAMMSLHCNIPLQISLWWIWLAKDLIEDDRNRELQPRMFGYPTIEAFVWTEIAIGITDPTSHRRILHKGRKSEYSKRKWSKLFKSFLFYLYLFWPLEIGPPSHALHLNPACCSGERRKLISHDWNLDMHKG